MKFPIAIPLAMAFLLGCFPALTASASARADESTTNAMPQSVFVMPSSPKDGRDPFFPDSLRPYQTAAAAHPKAANMASLKVLGFSGDVPNRFVIINNHTFAAGDEGDVTTPTGRIHLRCIEVKTNSVVIEVGGRLRELFYSNQP